jgi:hypothetical protein
MEQLIKIILSLFCVSLLLSFQTTNENPRELIVRKWKLEEKSIEPALRQRIKTLKKTDPEKAAKIEDNFEDVVKVTRSTIYEFLEDGTYKVKVMLMSEKFRWQILDDNKTLVVKSEKAGEITKVIIALTNEKLILQDKEPDAPEITYLPAD